LGRRHDDDLESSSLDWSIEIVGEGDGDGDDAAGGARASIGRLRARGAGGAPTHSSGKRAWRPMDARLLADAHVRLHDG